MLRIIAEIFLFSLGVLPFSLGVLPFFAGTIYAQEGRGDLRFVFYNVENLFDPFDDSLTLDEEFISGGIKGWSWERFLEKENGIYKVLTSAGGWKPPELIGLCEVENRFVLNWLTRKTPFLKYNYRVIHQESPDRRGIDVALLYLPGAFEPIDWMYKTIDRLPEPTRDILYVKGLALKRDTLHMILCHWPSRWEGYLESRHERVAAAQVVRELLDSILDTDKGARILIAGDLNDELSDRSISEVLRVQIPAKLTSGSGSDSGGAYACISDTVMYSTRNREQTVPGTIKYRGRWYEFDHIFASGSFIMDSVLFVQPEGKRIYAPEFLLENDPVWLGIRPFRTYYGFRYMGGISDHLPVYIDIWKGE